MIGKLLQWGLVLGFAVAFTTGIVTFTFDQPGDADAFSTSALEPESSAPEAEAVRLADEAPMAVAGLEAPVTANAAETPATIPIRRVNTVAVLPDGSLSFAPGGSGPAAQPASEVPWNEVLLDGSAGETVVARNDANEPWLPANLVPGQVETITPATEVAAVEVPAAADPVVEEIVEPVVETPPAGTGERYTINADALNFHSGPDGDTPTIFQVMGGVEVEVIEWDRLRIWAKARHTDGQEGWGYKGFLDPV